MLTTASREHGGSKVEESHLLFVIPFAVSYIQKDICADSINLLVYISVTKLVS